VGLDSINLQCSSQTSSSSNARREAEDLGAIHTAKLGVRSIDLLHIGLALTLKATEFLTYDTRQASLAKAAGLKVKP